MADEKLNNQEPNEELLRWEKERKIAKQFRRELMEYDLQKRKNSWY